MPSNIEHSRTIKVKHRGNPLGFLIFKLAIKIFGLKGAYGLLYFVCLHYLLFDRGAVKAAMVYLSKRFPQFGRLRLNGAVYKLFINQGRSLIDRFCSISGALPFDSRFDGLERIEEILQTGDKGIILLMSHMGNWQMAMSYLPEFNRKVHLLMRPEDNPAVRESLKVSASGEKVQVISPEGYLGGAIEMTNALNAGDIVSIMGDRSYGYNEVAVRLLDDEARLPYSAFSIAASVGCPVVALFSMKVSLKRYDIQIGKIFYPKYVKGLTKRAQLTNWVEDYANVLESFMEKHPYQCFLFLDIWQDPEKNASESTEKNKATLF